MLLSFFKFFHVNGFLTLKTLGLLFNILTFFYKQMTMTIVKKDAVITYKLYTKGL